MSTPPLTTGQSTWRHLKPAEWAMAAIRSGTIASIVIMPLAPLFKAVGLRIGHYGPKFAALIVNDPQPWFLFVQHLVIGWLSALPLLVILVFTGAGRRPLLSGALYGAAYYVLVNSLGLPLFFGDQLPWQMGAATVLPSLLGHALFGFAIGLASRNFLRKARRACGLDTTPAWQDVSPSS